MIRRVALKSLMRLLQLFKPPVPRTRVRAAALSASSSPYLTPQDLQVMAQTPITSAEAHAKAAFLDKMHFGYCALPEEVALVDYAQLPHQNTDGDGFARQFEAFQTELRRTVTPDYMNQFMHLFCLDKSAGSQFDDVVAQTFKGLFQVGGLSLYASVEAGIQQHLQSALNCSRVESASEGQASKEEHDEKAHLLIVCECLGGLVRASKLWSYDDVQAMWPMVMPSLCTAVEKASTSGYGAFISWLRWVSNEMDPRRFGPMKQYWLRLLQGQDPAAPGYSITTHHRVLHSLLTVCNETAWKDVQLNAELVDTTSQQLASPYQQVRDSLSKLMAQLYSCDLRAVSPVGTFTLDLPSPDPRCVQGLRRAIEDISSGEARTARAVTKTVLSIFSCGHNKSSLYALQPFVGYFLAATVRAFEKWYDETDAALAALLNTVNMQMAAITCAAVMVR